MVLYVSCLRGNCQDYLNLAAVVSRFVAGDVLLSGQLEESMRTAQANLVVLDGLLADGIRELVVP